MKRTAVLLTLALLATACASETVPTEKAELPQQANAPDRGKTSKTDHKKNEKPRARGKPGNKQCERDGEDPGGASAGAGDAEGDDGTEDRDEGTSTTRGSGTQSGGGASNYPAAGTYTFAQSGYEEFCDGAGRCDREDLPARQPSTLSYQGRSRDSATVVTEQKAGSRIARSWTRFTPSGGHITKFYVRMTYSGFRFERTYVPQPSIDAFRFPFEKGASWSGRWKAETSGSYSVRIGGPRRLNIGGRTVTAYPVDTTTSFTGDFEGRSRITAFVDARSKAIVASDGALNVTSHFGRYSTVFETKLLGGPGY